MWPGQFSNKGGLGDLAFGDQIPTARVERRSGSSTPLHWRDNGRLAYRGWYPWNNMDSSACRWSSTEFSRCRPSLRKWQEWCTPYWSSGLPPDGLLASCRLGDANRGQFHPCWTRPSLRTHQQQRGCLIALRQLLPCPAHRFPQNDKLTWSRVGLWTFPASLVRMPSLEHQDEALVGSVLPSCAACFRSGWPCLVAQGTSVWAQAPFAGTAQPDEYVVQVAGAGHWCPPPSLATHHFASGWSWWWLVWRIRHA